MTLRENEQIRLIGGTIGLIAEDEPGRPLDASLERAKHDGFEIDGCIHQSDAFGVCRGATESGLEVIIKHPSGRGDQRQKAAAQLRDEYQALSSIRHDAVVQVVSYVAGETGYLATVFEGDRDLTEWARATKPDRQALAEMLMRVVASVSVLHEAGLVHGDLKPQHVVIRDDGSPVLIDFGLTERWRDIDRSIQTSHRIGGTSHYMAPEIADSRVTRPDPSQACTRAGRSSGRRSKPRAAR
ncbi:MAG: protein kinase [Planctomycetota bacterium]